MERTIQRYQVQVESAGSEHSDVFDPKEKTMDTPTFKDPQQAFQAAIDAGRLSANPLAPHYAGKYMYMGTWGDRDTFKHSDTRQYLA